ncbi:MAG: response regulator transcription factor [Phycisphaeraceae bacterium]
MMTKAKQKRSEQPEPTTMARGHLLVVEDEEDLQDLLRYNLTREGFTVTCTDRGEQALRLVAERVPDLIVLDLMLPGMDGLEVCRTLKANPATAAVPVVMLTAKGEEADVVVGLEMGADDYVPKPFSPRVLTARLRAVLRRPKLAPTEEGEGEAAAIRVAGIEIFPDRHEVKLATGPVDLTATEFKLLQMMVRRPGRVFTRQQIIDTLHDGLAAVTDRSVDVQIVSLRRKLGEMGQIIQTVRGVGYRLREE